MSGHVHAVYQSVKAYANVIPRVVSPWGDSPLALRLLVTSLGAGIARGKRIAKRWFPELRGSTVSATALPNSSSLQSLHRCQRCALPVFRRRVMRERVRRKRVRILALGLPASHALTSVS